jgi:hypothetical protein
MNYPSLLQSRTTLKNCCGCCCDFCSWLYYLLMFPTHRDPRHPTKRNLLVACNRDLDLRRSL